MQLGPYQLRRPPLWALILAVPLMLALCGLGVWQIERAHYKDQLIAEHQAAMAAGVQTMSISDENDAPRREFHYIAVGHYDGKHQILLTDQMHGNQIGYEVWTPLVLDSGVQIMVDRGWIPKLKGKDGHAPNPRVPTGQVRIEGYWRGVPQPGFSFGENQRCNYQGWPRVLSYPNIATIRCQYQRPVADGLLLLGANQTGGYLRDWDEDPIGLRPWVHYTYAVQWFFMALLVIGLLGFLSSRRVDGDDSTQGRE